MRIAPSSLWFVLGLLAGGLACGPSLVAQPGPRVAPSEEARSPLGLPRSLRAPSERAPLIIDRNDLSLGTTVQYARVPSAQELDDLRFVRGFARLVITLDQWPTEYAPLEALNHLPPEAELVVVLPGYPPSRAAAQAWNLLDARARLIVLAQGPPPAGVVYDLEAMRGLERVVVDTEAPDRAGFERLQRPLSFRVVRD